MKNQRKYQKGITLIALVITIIVLLILAGVTLSIVFNGGIINKSQTAVDKYTEEQAKEKLSLALFEYKMDKVTKKEGIDLQTTLSKLGTVREAEEDTNYYEVEIDGYLFWVHKETLEIISRGPSNPVPPTKIEFSSATAEANIGEGKTFSLKLEPQNANPKFLKWSVNDESVAKIQNGVLTGLKEGTVIVTVTSTADVSKTASCTVTIKPIELTGITLNKTSTTIGMGKTETLEVTYTPANATYKDIVWSTSDGTIATVENGTVTGIKAGTATITATFVKNSSITEECNVTVEEIIEISTVEELKAFRDAVNSGTKYTGKKVVLTKDLNLNNEEWTSIGTSNTNYFIGTFDGQGHSISGLSINKSQNYQGLFGYTDGEGYGKSYTIIKDIILNNVNIKGGDYTAGIVGYGVYTKIENCGVSGNIEGLSHVAGIAGEAYEISRCYNTANVTSNGTYGEIGGIVGISRGDISNCYNIGNISGFCTIGGIVGYCSNTSAKVYNCYNVGEINYIASIRKYSYGGILGDMYGVKIKNCYNTGNVNGASDVGGIVGYLREYCNEISNCHSLGIIQGSSEVGAIIGTYFNWSNNITNCSYLAREQSISEIGEIPDGVTIAEEAIVPKTSLPSVLSVINGDNAFKEDSDGNIILTWEK